MTYYKLLIINGMGTKFLKLSTQMVVEPFFLRIPEIIIFKKIFYE